MIKQIDSLQSGGSLRIAAFHYNPYYFGGLEFFTYLCSNPYIRPL